MHWVHDFMLWTNHNVVKVILSKDQRLQRVRNCIQTIRISRECRIINVDFGTTDAQKRLIHGAGFGGGHYEET